MKKIFAFVAVSGLSLLPVVTTQAQSKDIPAGQQTRPRSVNAPPVTASAPKVAAPATATSANIDMAINPDRVALTARQFTPNVIRTRISEAERFFKSRPKQTAISPLSTNVVSLALLDRATGRLHELSVSKQTFLTKNSELTMTTSLGTPVTLRVLRANGVNTAVTATDAAGRALTPLLVEFPIEKFGAFKEMAYYTSAHPALLSNDLTKSGQGYVRSMIDGAAKRLREKGVVIAPHIVDVAERLCLVEHVDHDRFRNENRKALFDEIYSLYALNELDTYRYSVSSAGAGGMVQMIPWAYNLERQRHPGVGLTPDFVVGMRNHANALQAMLLYMQDTWNELTASEDVQQALVAKIATPTELLAAGYNSNAAKLPLYIRRGGNEWKSLIPRETQMYLQIYKAVDSMVPMASRTAAVAVKMD
jgi:hypothetical protein